MKVKDIIALIEEHAPVAIQEGFDNAGLVTGDPEKEISGALICLDVTEEVIEEAISRGLHLIISHHPVVFKGLKNLLPHDPVNRILLKAIRNDLSLYSAHTNLDKTVPGVSTALADQLGLINQKILVPDSGQLYKLVTFVPIKAAESVSAALFEAGAGRVGNYDSCSFQVEGRGSFRALEGAKPFVGEIGSVHYESEIRLEVLVPKKWKSRILKALLTSHPYEEVAYDLVVLENQDAHQGLGILGELPRPLEELQFLSELKEKLKLPCIRHTRFTGELVRKVAVCGGSGSEFLVQAKRQGAQVFVSGDFKYHQFFEAEGQILIADIGHFESEVFALNLIKGIVKKKFANFAVHLSKIHTNPIKYY